VGAILSEPVGISVISHRGKREKLKIISHFVQEGLK
jgi:hypothetical protein